MLVSRERVTRAMGTVSARVSGSVTIRVNRVGRPGRAAGALARSGVAVASVTGCWRRAAYKISASAMGGFSLTRGCCSVWGRQGRQGSSRGVGRIPHASSRQSSHTWVVAEFAAVVWHCIILSGLVACRDCKVRSEGGGGKGRKPPALCELHFGFSVAKTTRPQAVAEPGRPGFVGVGTALRCLGSR